MPKGKIIPQMFDVRPVDAAGDLDWKRIEEVEKLSVIREEGAPRIPAVNFSIPETQPRKATLPPKHSKVYLLGQAFESEEVPVFNEHEADFNYPSSENKANPDEKTAAEIITPAEVELPARESLLIRKLADAYHFFHSCSLPRIKLPQFSLPRFSFFQRFDFSFNLVGALFSFLAVAFLITAGIGGVSFWKKSQLIKGKVLGVSQDGYDSLEAAIGSIKSQNFLSSMDNFSEAYEKFSLAAKEMDQLGGVLVDTSKFIPFASQLSSGKNIIEAGQHVSLAGKALTQVTREIAQIENPLKEDAQGSLLELFSNSEESLRVAEKELQAVAENLKQVKVSDLPEDKQAKFVLLKQNLPEINAAVSSFLNNSHIFKELLGGNGPRKYLFLFQNNQEMRATGGFIGSYGLLDIRAGHIRQFFIDGIFNPDGQLKDKIVPPQPIQKVSATWSLHDSNWFPHFPTSAQKAIVFFEKTGGPTADGVITLTPTVIQKLLAVTGPIEMEEYGVTLDSENFIAAIQQEVEIDYNKRENNPKKILADLAPRVLEKLFTVRDFKSLSRALDAFLEGLNEKHILLYSSNKEIENIISQAGWSGEILSTNKDYLSVINTNINGYKTDGVIKETIEHSAEIQTDGTITDTVKITRQHQGGKTDFEWWNKVNADYLRVYVPQGSELISVSGQTREFNEPPLDYDALKFKRDAAVEQEEQGMTVDEKTGTRTYQENGKTVFANWTYVSPQETMTLEYKYRLPFKINFSGSDRPADSYSLLVQKQAGSLGSQLRSIVDFPADYEIAWSFPQELKISEKRVESEVELTTDRFLGLTFTQKSND